MAWILN